MPARVFTDGRNAIDVFGTERELYIPESTICYECGAQWSCSTAYAMRERNRSGTHSAIVDCEFAQTGVFPRIKAFLRTWRLYISLSHRYALTGHRKPKRALFFGRFRLGNLLKAITQFRKEGGVPFCTSIDSDPKTTLVKSERKYVKKDEYVTADGIIHRSKLPENAESRCNGGEEE